MRRRMSALSTVTLMTLLASLVYVMSSQSRSVFRLKLAASQEERLLKDLQTYLESQRTRVEQLSNLAEAIGQRVLETEIRKESQGQAIMNHPVNQLHFVSDWLEVTDLIAEQQNDTEVLRALLHDGDVSMPTRADVADAHRAMLRLFHTYAVPPADFLRGTLNGMPSVRSLSYQDVLHLASQALGDNFRKQALEWLGRLGEGDIVTSRRPTKAPNVAAMLKLKIYLQAGMISESKEILDGLLQTESDEPAVSSLAAHVDHLLTLGLPPNYPTTPVTDPPAPHRHLCDFSPRPIKQRTDTQCRYRRGVHIPYYSYKEETLSLEPRISLFYDVITDHEAEVLKQLALDRMSDALVGVSGKETIDTSKRSAQSAFIDEPKSSLPCILSSRVSDITGLVTSHRKVRTSAEAWQIANYGIGGHYDPHIDFTDSPGAYKGNAALEHSGRRLATFMLYLSDVEAGGATIFIHANVSIRVTPVKVSSKVDGKNAALFWYNLKPTGKGDFQTAHAACPVLLGDKWVANKWIWEYANENHQQI